MLEDEAELEELEELEEDFDTVLRGRGWGWGRGRGRGRGKVRDGVGVRVRVSERGPGHRIGRRPCWRSAPPVGVRGDKGVRARPSQVRVRR